jgi:hypothetical protein
MVYNLVPEVLALKFPTHERAFLREKEMRFCTAVCGANHGFLYSSLLFAYWRLCRIPSQI